MTLLFDLHRESTTFLGTNNMNEDVRHFSCVSQSSNSSSSSSVNNDHHSAPSNDVAMMMDQRRRQLGSKPPTVRTLSGGATSNSSTANKEKTVCAVCKVVSDNHHIHYGALACFSCRAFFRRAHGKGDGEPGYVCKKEGSCDISDKNRKKCQKCRYDKCIEAGMNPKQVLNAEQKKVRFRKMLEKKGTMRFSRKRGSGGNSATHRSSSDDDEEDEEEEEEEPEDPMARWTKAIALEGEHSLTRCHSDNFGPVVVSDFKYHPGMKRSHSSEALSRRKAVNVANSQLSQLNQHNQQPCCSSSAENVVANPGLIDESNIKREILSEIGIWNDGDDSCSANAFPEPPPQQDEQLTISSQQQQQQQPHWSLDTDSVQSLRALLDLDSQDEPLQQQQQPYIPDNTLRPTYASQDSSLSRFSFEVPPDNDDNSDDLLSAHISLEQLHSIVQAFDFASVNVKLDPEVLKRLISYHQGNTSALLNDDFRQIVAYKGQQLRLFSSRIDTFSVLPLADKTNLLNANTPLFVHYIIAQYVSASSGLEQVQWLLPDTVMPDFMSKVSLRRVSLETFIKTSGLFGAGVDAASYGNLVAEVGRLNLGRYHSPFIAAVLLFVHQSGISLEKSGEVSIAANALVNFLSNPNFQSIHVEKSNLELLINLLGAITDFGKRNVGVPSQHHNEVKTKVILEQQQMDPLLPSPEELEMGYTVEEEAWLTNQMSKFRQAYNEVSLGDELVNEFVMFTYDVPLSKHFIPSEISAFVERCRRIMKIHPEFSDLADTEQNRVWAENCYKAAAICSVKSETFRTGSEQLKFCFGGDDEESFNRKFSPLIHTKIKKVLVTDWNRTSKAMDTNLLINYLQLNAKLSTSVEDLETFMLIALMTLFSGESATSNAMLARLERKYSTIFRRRVMAFGTDKSQVSKIRSGLESVEELACIFKNLTVVGSV